MSRDEKATDKPIHVCDVSVTYLQDARELYIVVRDRSGRLWGRWGNQPEGDWHEIERPRAK